MYQKDAEKELQEVLTKTFYSNLNFFKEIDIKLFQKIELLNIAIEKEIYKSRYDLEFIYEEGDFDIYDKKENKYLYKKKSNKYNKNTAKTINFDRKGYFSVIEDSLYKNEITNLYIDKNQLQENEDSNILLSNDLSKYIQILKEDMKEKKKSFKQVDKFIFIGILLGRHIPNILKKIKAKSYFIHEPNLEIFRLSLFVFDYTVFLTNNARVFISIMDEPTVFEEKVFDFLSLDSWSNHTIKYHTSDYNVRISFDNIINAIISFKPTIFNYNMYLHNIYRNLCSRINQYRLITFPIDKKIDFFQNKPVIYVCSGPSLGDNIKWLEKNKDSFVIVTIGAAYKKLLDNNIEPHVIITIDSKYKDLDKLQFDENICSKISDTLILASINTDQRILNRFNQNKLYLFDVLTTLKENSVPPIGYSVGEIGYQILLELGVEKLYLLGTDLAIHQEQGTSHGTDSSGEIQHYDLKNIKNDFTKNNYFNLRTDLIKVKGNLKPKVYTNRSFNSSINIYNKISERLIDNFSIVYNLSNHGAYFNNVIPLNINEFNLPENKIKFNKNYFANKIDEISTLGLTAIEQNKIKIELMFLDNIKNKCIENSNKNYNSYLNFKNDALLLNNFIMDYSTENKTFFGHILSNYFSIINPYIDYCFNDSEIKNEEKKIKEIASIWFVDIIKITNEYIEYTNKIV